MGPGKGRTHLELAISSRYANKFLVNQPGLKPLESVLKIRRWKGHFMDIMNLDEMRPFTTMDGSEIRELLAYRNSCIRKQSLAEARLGIGCSTQEHFHKQTEEIYFITQGTGKMRIDGKEREVRPGDAIAIPPGCRHKLWNTGKEPLRLLCCCAPAYEHADTFLCETG